MQAYNRNKSVEGLTANIEMASSSRFVTPVQTEKIDSHIDTNNTGYHGSLSSLPKLEFPKFDGEEPKAWIRKCNRYFQIANSISEEKKILLLLFILKVKLKEPECMVDEFNKQQQTGSVSEYLETFEELKPYMMIFYSHFPDSYFTASFMSGLKEEIRANVRIMKPTTPQMSSL
ncbi:hypothetical protein Sango_1751400 [Sesamum angolense]|uniref:Retrotransposon gag domain-containing protein n=1 Tax=Sesamum angolense TaxID=2727404 RepID=A0AAE1WMF5_9LAMI|nr:hypothetical protein Sango_1751400 [Sesamum angolense]